MSLAKHQDGSRKTDFCKFCGEPNETRRSSTCSEECANALIEHEFANVVDVERACLYCPSRGDLFEFKTPHLCNSCYELRLQYGACSKCGGPLKTYGCCMNCTHHVSVFSNRPAGQIAQTVLLLDPDTHRVRRAYRPSKWIPKGIQVKVSGSRRAFEKMTPIPKEVFCVLDYSVLQGINSIGLLRTKLKSINVFVEVGKHFTLVNWREAHVRLNGPTTKSATDRYFEREKSRLRAAGIKMDLIENSEDPAARKTMYEMDHQALIVLQRYYTTLLENIKMGYCWK